MVHGQEIADLARIRAALKGRKPVRRRRLGQPAAVLIPLLPTPEGLQLLFTERSRELRAHSGQISFPGGRIDPGDTTDVAAALRESYEEVGLRSEHVEVLGQLDDSPTSTGFVIAPVVGVVSPLAFTAAGRYPWTPSPAEIAALHELPLRDFLEPKNLRVEQREFRGNLYDVHWYTVRGTVVWGATARLVHDLLELSFPGGLT